MKNVSTYIAIAAVGFCAGQFVRPHSAKAGSAPRIVHVQVGADWSVVPGSAYGTPVSVSCPKEGDCYVLIPGN